MTEVLDTTHLIDELDPDFLASRFQQCAKSPSTQLAVRTAREDMLWSSAGDPIVQTFGQWHGIGGIGQLPHESARIALLEEMAVVNQQKITKLEQHIDVVKDASDGIHHRSYPQSIPGGPIPAELAPTISVPRLREPVVFIEGQLRELNRFYRDEMRKLLESGGYGIEVFMIPDGQAGPEDLPEAYHPFHSYRDQDSGFFSLTQTYLEEEARHKIGGSKALSYISNKAIMEWLNSSPEKPIKVPVGFMVEQIQDRIDIHKKAVELTQSQAEARRDMYTKMEAAAHDRSEDFTKYLGESVVAPSDTDSSKQLQTNWDRFQKMEDNKQKVSSIAEVMGVDLSELTTAQVKGILVAISN